MNQRIYPALRYRDARAAVDWLTNAFGFEPKQIHEGDDGRVAYAELVSESGVLSFGEPPPAGQPDRWGQPTGSAYLYAVVADPDAHFARATAAGAEITMELTDQPYGSRDYAAKDLEGNVWCFGTYDPAA
jgi:uncharacterized glyoxalase superfamily protein PhnB